MQEQLLLLIVLVSTAGIAAQWTAWRLGLPVIILLLIAGFLLGPLTGVLQPGQSFGALLDPAIGLAVAIIVLQEGMGLDFAELRSSGQGLARVIGLGLPLVWLMSAVAAHVIAGLSWPVSILIGVMLVITGPTVISPLLRQAKLAPRIDAVLRWESILNDAVGAVLTVVVLEFLLLWDAARRIEAPAAGIAADLAAGTLMPVALGAGTAFALRFMFDRNQVPEFLKAPLVLAAGLLIYTLSDVMQPEAGLIAVAVLGVGLANLGLPEIADLKRFTEALGTFLVSGVFIVLTASVEIGRLRDLPWTALAGAAGFVAVSLLVVRPLAMGVATLGSDLSWRERLFVGLIAPRGIVVAALAGFAGTRLAGSGFDQAWLIAPLVFLVIIATVVLHGLVMGPLARALGLAAEQRPGLLIVGAGAWTTALAKALSALGTPIVLSDRSSEALEKAEGLAVTTHTGHLLAPEEEDAGLLTEAEYLLAATGDDSFNALLCRKFATELGQQNVFQTGYGDRDDAAPRFHREWRGNLLIDPETTIAELDRRLAAGWRFARETLRHEDAGAVLRPSPGERLPIVLLRDNGELLFASPETKALSGAHGTLVVFEAPRRQAGGTAAAAPHPPESRRPPVAPPASADR